MTPVKNSTTKGATEDSVCDISKIVHAVGFAPFSS